MAKMQQLTRSDRMMFSASDDSAMMKQIQATHAPDGREIDVKPILQIIEDILRRASPSIDGVLNGTSGQVEALEENAALAAFEGMLEALSYIIHKISCELSCKCSGGGDAHATTMVLFNTLTNYSWDAKMVLTLAAFAVNYGEFWLVAQLCTRNSLAKSVAFLKQLPDILENYNSLKPQFDAVNKLIKAMLDLTKCIIEFKELPSQYISTDFPAMSIAMTHIPAAAYWTIRSIVACSSQIASLIGLRAEYISSTTEAWELSSLAHKVSSIHEHLKKQIKLCHQHIEEKREIEAYHNLVRLLETIHMDNMKVLRALIYAKDDRQPLVEGSTNNTVHVEVLRRKHVLLLISDLDLSHEEILILDHMYRESKAGGSDHYYEIVWLPVVDRSVDWHEGLQNKFEQLQAMMQWYSVLHPSLIEPAVIKYIKEMWHFSKKPILVPLDPQGRVLNQNAFNMLWIWRNQAFPFTSEREQALWSAESWGLELLVDRTDVTVLNWVAEGKYICVYGGEDMEWIRKFTSAAKSVAYAANIALEMVYVGKSNARERLRKIITIIMQENLSYSLTDSTFIWFFWARLESMLYSKSRHGKTVENDHIMQEVMTILGFDGGDEGWAIFCQGRSKEMARAKGDRALRSMLEFENWSHEVSQSGFVPGLNYYLQQLHTPHHCNRLILPGTDGGLPGKVACAECGRIMERFFMYRCCVD